MSRNLFLAWTVTGVMSLGIFMPTLYGDRSHADHETPSGYVGQSIGSLALIDQRGRKQSLAALRGNPYLLSFFCTKCAQAGFCEDASGKLAFLQQHLSTNVHIEEISFDPERDTPEAIRAYAKQFGANASRWTMGSGIDGENAVRFAARFGVRQEIPSGDRTHANVFFLIDRDGRIAERDEAGTFWKADDLLSDIDVVNGSSSGPGAWLAFTLHRIAGISPSYLAIASALPLALYLIASATLFSRKAA